MGCTVSVAKIKDGRHGLIRSVSDPYLSPPIKCYRDRKDETITCDLYVAALRKIDRRCFRCSVDDSVLIAINREAERRRIEDSDGRHISRDAWPPFYRIESGPLQAVFELSGNILPVQVFPRGAKPHHRKSNHYGSDRKHDHQF